MQRALFLGIVFVVGVVVLPRRIASGGWSESFYDDRERARLQAQGMEHWAEQSAEFSTGSRKFDGEWAFGTHLMAALGHGQVAVRHPELASHARASMDRALSAVLRPETRSFDRDAWGSDALETLSSDEGHVAFLGYANLALSLRKKLGPSPFDELNARITDALARRLGSSEIALLETYPGERYPVDNAAAIASIALHDRASGREPRPIVGRALSVFRERWLDRPTRLLIQAVNAAGEPVDSPRGSGSALASYFLSFADRELSLSLARAVQSELSDTVLGFGVVSEYPAGDAGRGDIDSGPLVFGWSISAMGFALGAAKVAGEDGAFRELWRSYRLFGAPHAARGRMHFVSGGALGDAILFAMTTALPPSTWGAS
jgi:hypothetical protein